jgi:hypothetical protein
MKRQTILILNIAALVIIFLAIVFILILYLTGQKTPETECINPDSLVNLKSSACYNPISQEVMLALSRGFDNYKINRISFSFIDNVERKAAIRDVPGYNEIKRFNFTSSKDPGKARITLEIDSSINLCSTFKTILITTCENLGVYANLTEQERIKIGSQQEESDTIPIELLNGHNWTSSCISNWQCNAWEDCLDGIQKRSCMDTKNCLVQSNMPDLTKYCNQTCKEDWQCQWGRCLNGYTTPDCTDRNNCGTTFSKPSELSCSRASDNCIPSIICDPWSSCNLNLDIVDFSNLQNIKGKQTRICRDKNNCIPITSETKECSTKINIYTKEIDWHGGKYLEVYDNLTNKLLSRVRYASGELPSLDLNFYLN